MLLGFPELDWDGSGALAVGGVELIRGSKSVVCGPNFGVADAMGLREALPGIWRSSFDLSSTSSGSFIIGSVLWGPLAREEGATVGGGNCLRGRAIATFIDLQPRASHSLNWRILDSHSALSGGTGGSLAKAAGRGAG